MREMVLGVVVGVSHDGGRYALRTGYGYVVADAEPGDLRAGEAVVGALREHGEVTVTSQETGARCVLYVEAIDAGEESARSLLASR